MLSIAKDCVIAKAALICDVNLIDRTISFIENLRKKRKHVLPLDTTPSDTTTSDSDYTTPADTDTVDVEQYGF
ncbi:MAG: hypothetical protein M3P08_05145 [Thermoproteota archaeon]|nr:hypothetical protein [Thermoproteota archaeon]